MAAFCADKIPTNNSSLNKGLINIKVPRDFFQNLPCCGGIVEQFTMVDFADADGFWHKEKCQSMNIFSEPSHCVTFVKKKGE